jgi:hypothetical protein
MRGSRVFALVGAVLVAALGAAVPARADPAVTLDQPAALNPQVVSGVAGHEPSDAKSVTIDFFPGATATGVAAASALAGTTDGGAFAAAVPQLGDGTWTVRATQADTAGNTGVSAPRTFRIDIRAPQVELTAPDAVTADAVPHFEGVAGTAEGDLSTITLTVTGPGGSTSFTAFSKGGWFSGDAPGVLADGTYTVVAGQADDLGHVGTDARTFVIDTTPPVVPPASPDAEVPATTDPAPVPVAPAAPAAPRRAPTKAAAELKIASATASRRGRTITLKLSGTAATTATGQVQVTVAGVRGTAKLTRGAWSVTLRITKTAKTSLKATVTYGGDGGFTAVTVKRTLRVR